MFFLLFHSRSTARWAIHSVTPTMWLLSFPRHCCYLATFFSRSPRLERRGLKHQALGPKNFGSGGIQINSIHCLLAKRHMAQPKYRRVDIWWAVNVFVWIKLSFKELIDFNIIQVTVLAWLTETTFSIDPSKTVFVTTIAKEKLDLHGFMGKNSG